MMDIDKEFEKMLEKMHLQGQILAIKAVKEFVLKKLTESETVDESFIEGNMNTALIDLYEKIDKL